MLGAYATAKPNRHAPQFAQKQGCNAEGTRRRAMKAEMLQPGWGRQGRRDRLGGRHLRLRRLGHRLGRGRRELDVVVLDDVGLLGCRLEHRPGLGLRRGRGGLGGYDRVGEVDAPGGQVDGAVVAAAPIAHALGQDHHVGPHVLLAVLVGVAPDGDHDREVVGEVADQLHVVVAGACGVGLADGDPVVEALVGAELAHVDLVVLVGGTGLQAQVPVAVLALVDLLGDVGLEGGEACGVLGHDLGVHDIDHVGGVVLRIAVVHAGLLEGLAVERLVEAGVRQGAADHGAVADGGVQQVLGGAGHKGVPFRSFLHFFFKTTTGWPSSAVLFTHPSTSCRGRLSPRPGAPSPGPRACPRGLRRPSGRRCRRTGSGG